MSYLFFIFAPTNNSNFEDIKNVLKVEKEDKFNEPFITFIEQNKDYQLYLGYFKKKFEESSVQTKILIDINDKTFESKEFIIPKYESIFLNYIEFGGYYRLKDKAFNFFFPQDIIPPKCHKLNNYFALKIYLENLYKLIHKDKNIIKFQLLKYFNQQYQKSNEKTLQFYLLLFKHCYDYNSKNNKKKIYPEFDFNLKVENENLIEKEFGEMIDNISFNYDLDKENDNLIKLILFYYYRINENKFHEFLENNNIMHKIISLIIQNN